MAGFPDAPSRQAFGDILDPVHALNPKRDIGGQTFNLGWWQVAGSGLMVPRAWAVVSALGSRIAAAEAWNPNQDSTLHPTVVHPTTGRFVLVFASSAPNEEGTTRAINFLAVDRVTPQAADVDTYGNGAFVSPTAWASGTAYAKGAIVSNGGKLYYCITAGTSAGSGGPTGTGTSITDNTAAWCYLAAAAGVVVASIVIAQAGAEVDCAFLVAVR